MTRPIASEKPRPSALKISNTPFVLLSSSKSVSTEHQSPREKHGQLEGHVQCEPYLTGGSAHGLGDSLNLKLNGQLPHSHVRCQASN